MMTDFSREGGDPPNTETRAALKRRPFNARLFAEDIVTVMIVAAREGSAEQMRQTIASGVNQVVTKHGLLRR